MYVIEMDHQESWLLKLCDLTFYCYLMANQIITFGYNSNEQKYINDDVLLFFE